MAETSSNTVTVPTDTQMQFLTCIMKNLKVKPDVDWDAVASEQNISAKSARERYRLICIKLGWNAGPNNGGGGGGGATPKKSAGQTTPKKPTGVTKRAGKVGTKAQQKGPKAKAKGRESAEDDEDGTDELMSDHI